MEAIFNEINSLLDKVKGGYTGTGYFGGIADPQGEVRCSEKCRTECKEGSIGTKVGAIEGIELPDPSKPVNPDPPINGPIGD